MRGRSCHDDPDDATLKAERDAAEFEKLLEQLDRMARDKTPPKRDPEKDVDVIVDGSNR